MAKRPLAGEQVAEALLAGVLFGYSVPRRGPKAVGARLAGSALLFAAFAPALTRQLLRVGAARRRVHLRTSFQIDRPVRDVFSFCRDFENFPRVVHSLHSIVDYQDGRSRWEVRSPNGEILAWDAVVTKYVPNVVIAWRSIPGAVVDCNGLIRFSPTPRGGTRLQIAVDYDPRHTGLSDAVRALFDASGTEQLERDLARANIYLTLRRPVSRLVADDAEGADATDAGDNADVSTHSA
jgi:uncharacterized membrane protein